MAASDGIACVVTPLATASFIAVIGNSMPVRDALDALPIAYPGTRILYRDQLEVGSTPTEDADQLPPTALVPEAAHPESPLEMRFSANGDRISFDAYVPDTAFDVVTWLLARYRPQKGSWIWVGFGHDGAALPLAADMSIEDLRAALEDPPSISQLRSPNV